MDVSDNTNGDITNRDDISDGGDVSVGGGDGDDGDSDSDSDGDGDGDGGKATTIVTWK